MREIHRQLLERAVLGRAFPVIIAMGRIFPPAVIRLLMREPEATVLVRALLLYEVLSRESNILFDPPDSGSLVDHLLVMDLRRHRGAWRPTRRKVVGRRGLLGEIARARQRKRPRAPSCERRFLGPSPSDLGGRP